MPHLRPLILCLTLPVACGPAAGSDPSMTPAGAPAEPVALATATLPRAPAPTVLWTSPPTIPPTPTPAPTPVPIAVVVPTAPSPTRSPSPTPSPRPTPTPDPLKWTGYKVNGGPAIYAPTTWPALDPSVLGSLAIFGASPEPPRASLLSYRRRVTLQGFATNGSVDLQTFADAFQRTVLGSLTVTRETIAHPSGTVVTLKYQEHVLGGIDQEIDTIFVTARHVYVLGMRSPVEQFPSDLPVFQQVFARFSPD